jgi:hypothetical protein
VDELAAPVARRDLTPAEQKQLDACGAWYARQRAEQADRDAAAQFGPPDGRRGRFGFQWRLALLACQRPPRHIAARPRERRARPTRRTSAAAGASSDDGPAPPPAPPWRRDDCLHVEDDHLGEREPDLQEDLDIDRRRLRPTARRREAVGR